MTDVDIKIRAFETVPINELAIMVAEDPSTFTWLLDQLRAHREALQSAIFELENVKRRAGSASHQSGYTDALEVAEWAKETLKKIRPILSGVEKVTVKKKDTFIDAGLAENVRLGYVEVCGEEDGKPLYRLTEKGKAYVRGMPLFANNLETPE